MMIFYIFTISIIFQFGTIICTALPTTVNPCHNRSNISKPYNLNCTHFIECDQTNEVIKACGPGTVFDEKNGICNWPSQVAQCSDLFLDYKSIKESSNKYNDESENTLNSISRSVSDPDQPQWNTNQNQQLNGNNVQNNPPVSYGKQSIENGYKYPVSNIDATDFPVRKEYTIKRIPPNLLDKRPDESRNKPGFGQLNPGQSFGSYNQNNLPVNDGEQFIKNGYKYPVSNIDATDFPVRKEYPIKRIPLNSLDKRPDESRNKPYNKQSNIIEESDDESAGIDPRVKFI